MFSENSLPTMLLWLGILFIIVDQPAPGFGQKLEYKKFDEQVQKTKADLKCIACNSKYGPCYETIDPISCKDDYIRQVYGTLAVPQQDLADLNTWPDALSELYRLNATGSLGWAFKGYPAFYDLSGSRFKDSGKGVRISSLNNQMSKKKDGFVEGGFKSCRKMTIVTSNQINGGKRQELSEAAPRIIRTCSFVKPKRNEDGFDDKGCKLFIYKTVSMEICYCDDKAGCNGSSYLRVSHWIIVASLIILVAQFVSNRND